MLLRHSAQTTERLIINRDQHTNRTRAWQCNARNHVKGVTVRNSIEYQPYNMADA